MRLFPTCQEVTRRVLASAEQAPTATEQLRLRLHWAVCENCRRFRRQSALLREAMPTWRKGREP